MINTNFDDNNIIVTRLLNKSLFYSTLLFFLGSCLQLREIKKIFSFKSFGLFGFKYLFSSLAEALYQLWAESQNGLQQLTPLSPLSLRLLLL